MVRLLAVWAPLRLSALGLVGSVGGPEMTAFSASERMAVIRAIERTARMPQELFRKTSNG